MSRELDPTVLANLNEDVVYPLLFLEMFFDGNQTLRLWSGLGELNFSGNVFFGTGTILGISAIEETAELAARGATLTLSAVPQEVISLALQTPYQGRRAVVSLGFARLSPGSLVKEDGDFLLTEDGDTIGLEFVTGADEIFAGYMDTMDIEDNGSDSTLTLTVQNKLVTLERQRVVRYTSEYQKTKFPADTGFDFVESIQDKVIYWGRKGN